jgi:hypothetical protein
MDGRTENRKTDRHEDLPIDRQTDIWVFRSVKISTSDILHTPRHQGCSSTHLLITIWHACSTWTWTNTEPPVEHDSALANDNMIVKTNTNAPVLAVGTRAGQNRDRRGYDIHRLHDLTRCCDTHTSGVRPLQERIVKSQAHSIYTNTDTDWHESSCVQWSKTLQELGIEDEDQISVHQVSKTYTCSVCAYSRINIHNVCTREEEGKVEDQISCHWASNLIMRPFMHS